MDLPNEQKIADSPNHKSSEQGVLKTHTWSQVPYAQVQHRLHQVLVQQFQPQVTAQKLRRLSRQAVGRHSEHDKIRSKMIVNWLCVGQSLREGIGTTNSVQRMVRYRGHLHSERELLVREKRAQSALPAPRWTWSSGHPCRPLESDRTWRHKKSYTRAKHMQMNSRISLVLRVESNHSVDHRFLSTSTTLSAAQTSSCCSAIMCCLWLCRFVLRLSSPFISEALSPCSMCPSSGRWIVGIPFAIACWNLSEDCALFDVPWLLLGIPDLDWRERTVVRFPSLRFVGMQLLPWFCAVHWAHVIPFRACNCHSYQVQIPNDLDWWVVLSICTWLSSEPGFGDEGNSESVLVAACNGADLMRCEKLALLLVRGATNFTPCFHDLGRDVRIEWYPCDCFDDPQPNFQSEEKYQVELGLTTCRNVRFGQAPKVY